MLDLSAGTYDVADEVGAAMWSQLIAPPETRDIAGAAATFGAPRERWETDLADFATVQVAAGRLVTERPRAAPATVAPRHRPSALRAWWERARADRDLKRSFADAYATRTGPTADTAAPRADVERLTKVFRTAESLYPSREAPLDCLPRSLALTRFLRTSGWPARHVIGVALYPFEAHAWVDLDGVALNEGATYLERFAVIQRA